MRLRDYQKKAIADIRLSFRRHGAIVFVLPTGAGKSAIASHISSQCELRGKSVLFLAPRRELIYQISDHFQNSGVDHGTIMAGEPASFLAKHQIACIPSLHRRAIVDGRIQLPRADLVIVDECFPAGTPVSTPLGQSSIEDIRVGDSVVTACGPSKVVAKSCKHTSELYEVCLNDGQKITCTGNHPFFTESGWQEARALGRGSRVFREQDMPSLWGNGDALLQKRAGSRGSAVALENDLLKVLLKEVQEPMQESFISKKDGGYPEKDRSQAEDSRRKWAGANSTATCPVQSVRRWMEDGVCAEYVEGRQNFWRSRALQDRHCQPLLDDSDRGGRGVSCQLETSRAGQEKGRKAIGVRVESVSRFKCESPRAVYNLQVEGHPSYFAKGVLVHNCHIGIGGTAQELIQRYKDSGAFVLGLTATPARTDGRGLGEIYDDMVTGPTVRELIAQGYLVQPRYFRGSHPDMDGVKIHAGDYHQGEAGKRADDTTLIGDVVSNWARLASDRQTFVFCASKAHSRHLCQRFRDIGIAAEHIDSDTETQERREIQQRLRTGETQVICNVEVMTYGVDFPPVSCIVLAKPTKSVARYLQMVGRGLRPADGKQSCYVLDHANAIRDVGFVEDDMPWSLDGKEKIQDRREKTKTEPKDIECPSCGTVFRSQPFCPICGHELKSEHQEAIKALEADLEEIDRKTKEADKRQWSVEDKARFFGMLKGYAIQKGYKRGWAAWAYRDKFGVWPNDKRIKNSIPEKPDKEVQGWIQHLQIKKSHSKKPQGTHKKATPEQVQGVREALGVSRTQSN